MESDRSSSASTILQAVVRRGQRVHVDGLLGTAGLLALDGDASDVRAAGDIPQRDVLLHAVGETGALGGRQG